MSSESKPKIFSKVEATLDTEWLGEQSSKQSVSEILTQIENLGEGKVQISFRHSQHVVSGSLELINRIHESLVYGTQEKYTSIVSSQLFYNIRLNALPGVAEERSLSPDQFISCRDFSPRDERLKKNTDNKNDCKPGESKDKEDEDDTSCSSSGVKVIKSEDGPNVDENLTDQRKSGKDNFELPEKSGVEFIVLNESTESGNKEDKKKKILTKDFMVDPDIWRYIENNKRKLIENIKSNLGVLINSEEDESGVFKIIISGYDRENIDNSHSELVALYNDTFERCEIEETSYSYENEQQKKLLLSYMSKNFSDVYTEHNMENDSFMFIGPPEKVQSAKNHFKDAVFKLEREGPQSLGMPDTGDEFVYGTKAGAVSFSDSCRISPLNIGSSRRSVGSDGRFGDGSSRSFEHETGSSDHREHHEKNFEQSFGHTRRTEVGRNFSTRQPEPGGTVSYLMKKFHLPGYEDCQTFELTFEFTVYDSLENSKPFSLTTYLPVNEEGRPILRLMKQAFEENILFRICTPIEGDGPEEEVISNGVEFKMKINGKRGYPDPEYLDRVKRQLDHLLQK